MLPDEPTDPIVGIVMDLSAVTATQNQLLDDLKAEVRRHADDMKDVLRFIKAADKRDKRADTQAKVRFELTTKMWVLILGTAAPILTGIGATIGAWVNGG